MGNFSSVVGIVGDIDSTEEIATMKSLQDKYKDNVDIWFCVGRLKKIDLIDLYTLDRLDKTLFCLEQEEYIFSEDQVHGWPLVLKEGEKHRLGSVRVLSLGQNMRESLHIAKSNSNVDFALSFYDPTLENFNKDLVSVIKHVKPTVFFYRGNGEISSSIKNTILHSVPPIKTKFILHTVYASNLPGKKNSVNSVNIKVVESG